MDIFRICACAVIYSFNVYIEVDKRSFFFFFTIPLRLLAFFLGCFSVLVRLNFIFLYCFMFIMIYFPLLAEKMKYDSYFCIITNRKTMLLYKMPQCYFCRSG